MAWLEDEPFPRQRVPRETFDGLVYDAILSADSAAIKVREAGGTEADAMRAGVSAALAFVIGYGLVQVRPAASGRPSWYRIEIDPEEVIEP